MIQFFTGRAGSGKSTAIMEAVQAALEIPGRELVLLVPEQQTVAWEYKLSSKLPATANLRLEITNFTRLANSVFREYGGLSEPVIDEGSRSLLIWRAMLATWDRLKVYTGGAPKPDSKKGTGREDRNIPRLLQAVDELKTAGIPPADAEEVLRSMEAAGESGSDLWNRLSDAVMVYAAYNQILHEEYVDRGDLFRALSDTLATHPYFAGKSVFVDSFFSLTAPQERILGTIFEQAADVFVTFSCPKPEKGEPFEIQFGETRTFLKHAMALAARAGKTPVIRELRENHRHTDGDLRAVEEKLFRYGGNPGEKKAGGEGALPLSDSIRMIRCADRTDEAEAAAALIDRLLHEGYKCRDIVVLARNMKGRETILGPILRRHGIPCFLSETALVSTSPAVRFVLAALTVGSGGWQREDVIRLLGTGLTPVSLPENGAFLAEVFGNYTATWKIRGRRFYTAEDWTMNPGGYSEEMTEGGRELLRMANEARRLFVPQLDSFLSLFDNGPASVSAVAEGIVALAEAYRLDEGLRYIAEAYADRGFGQDAERVRDSWNAVCGILDRMVRELGDTVLDAGRFAGLFARVAQCLDTGAIPTALDEVVLGSASSVRFEEIRCVIILGSVEGEFPAVSSDGAAFFNDRDKLALEAYGLDLHTPDLATVTAREYYMYYRAVSAAKERLYILAPTGEDGEWSEGGRRIRAILEDRGRKTEIDFGTVPLKEIVYHPATAEYLLSRRADPVDQATLTALVGGGKPTEIPLTAEHDRVGPRPVGKGELFPLSQSKIDTFVSCPFRYTCQYLINVRPEAVADLGMGDIGTMVHYVLERFFADLPEREDLTALTDDMIRERADRIIDGYVRSLTARAGGRKAAISEGRLAYLIRRLQRYVSLFLRAAVDEVAEGGFRPAAFELPIGTGESGSLEGIRFTTSSGAVVTLRGKADRVDTYTADGREYIRIVDYKTGKKQFSVENIRNGMDVQLLIYLYSVLKYGLPGGGTAGERVPAAAAYYHVSMEPVTVQHRPKEGEAQDKLASGIGRSGVYLDDRGVLEAMDAELKGRYLNIKIKNGEPEGQKGTALLSEKEFKELYEELDEAVSRIAEEMCAGEARAKPRRTGGKYPCEFCDDRMICRVKETDRNA